MSLKIIFLCLLPFFTQAQSIIIPQPVELTMREGYFLIDSGTSIRFDKGEAILKPALSPPCSFPVKVYEY